MESPAQPDAILLEPPGDAWVSKRDGRATTSRASKTDLQRDPPALVILQKLDWHLGEALPNSAEFFLNNAELRAWLDAGYVPDRETTMFAVWRRRG